VQAVVSVQRPLTLSPGSPIDGPPLILHTMIPKSVALCPSASLESTWPRAPARHVRSYRHVGARASAATRLLQPPGAPHSYTVSRRRRYLVPIPPLVASTWQQRPRLPRRPPLTWLASVGAPRRGEGAAQTRFELQRPAGEPHLDLSRCRGAVLTRFEEQRPWGVPHPATGPGGGAAHPLDEGQRPVGVPHPAMMSSALPTQPRIAIAASPLFRPPSPAVSAGAPGASKRRGPSARLAQKTVPWIQSPTTCRPSATPPSSCPTSTDSSTANRRREAPSADRGFCEEAVTTRQAKHRHDAAPDVWRRRAATPQLVEPNQPPPRQTAAAGSAKIPRPKPTRFGR
jgi:hypothetical protein